MRQSWLSPLATRRPAGTKGMGIFADVGISAGTTVAGFGGCVVDRAELNAQADEIRTHALQIDDDLFIASELPFADADYVNHSCDPNCGIVGSILLVTMRDVGSRRGALLRLRDDRHRRLRRIPVLLLGTELCRGTITGADWKEPELPRPLPRLDLGLRRRGAARRTRWTHASDSSPRSTGRPPSCSSTSLRSASPRTRIPGLDVDEWMTRLDELAACCPEPTFEALRAHLFEPGGFAGNLDHYDDPENSFLDSVIVRRLGIPISLSVLMIMVGRRLGVDVAGRGDARPLPRARRRARRRVV